MISIDVKTKIMCFIDYEEVPFDMFEWGLDKEIDKLKNDEERNQCMLMVELCISSNQSFVIGDHMFYMNVKIEGVVENGRSEKN